MRADLGTMAVAATTVFASSTVAQDLTVRIGHAANVSGFLSIFGEDMENGARMAVDELNAKGVTIGGRKARFELVPADDKADQNQAAAAARTLVDAGVSGVVGHMFSSTSLAASKIYCPAGIPQISPGATAAELTRSGCKSTFRVLADDTRMGNALGAYAGKAMRAKKLAAIDDGSVQGQSIVKAFAAAATAAGATIVATAHADDKMTDFGAILSAIKPKGPDLVFFGGLASQGGPIIKQMKQLGIDARFMGADAVCQADLPMSAGDGWADGKVVCGLPGGAEFTAAPMGRFRADYKQRFGMDPLRYAPFAYDAVRVMADAMVRAGSSEPARYLLALAATRDYKGITGTITFDDKGDIVNAGVTLFGFKDRRRDPIATVP